MGDIQVDIIKEFFKKQRCFRNGKTDKDGWCGCRSGFNTQITWECPWKELGLTIWPLLDPENINSADRAEREFQTIKQVNRDLQPFFNYTNDGPRLTRWCEQLLKDSSDLNGRLKVPRRALLCRAVDTFLTWARLQRRGAPASSVWWHAGALKGLSEYDLTDAQAAFIACVARAKTFFDEPAVATAEAEDDADGSTLPKFRIGCEFFSWPEAFQRFLQLPEEAAINFPKCGAKKKFLDFFESSPEHLISLCCAHLVGSAGTLVLEASDHEGILSESAQFLEKLRESKDLKTYTEMIKAVETGARILMRGSLDYDSQTYASAWKAGSIPIEMIVENLGSIEKHTITSEDIIRAFDVSSTEHTKVPALVKVLSEGASALSLYIDKYGTLWSPYAGKGSILGFELDHRRALACGGRTTEENLEILQWHTNSKAHKGNRLHMLVPNVCPYRDFAKGKTSGAKEAKPRKEQPKEKKPEKEKPKYVTVADLIELPLDTIHDLVSATGGRLTPDTVEPIHSFKSAIAGNHKEPDLR